MAEKSAQEIGVERQGQFDLYLTGLAFTILGLAIQTSKIGAFYFSDATELLGWACLLLSGLCGLRRLEQAPEHYRVQQLRHDQQAKRRKAEEILLTRPHAEVHVLGEGAVPMRDYAQQAGADIPKIDRRLKALDRHISRLYRVQRSSLVAGLALLGIARASAAIAHFVALFGFRLL